MRPRLLVGVAFPMLLLAALVAACGGDGDGEADLAAQEARAAALAARLHLGIVERDRILGIGEPVGTIVDSQIAGLVPGLQAALNPSAVLTIDNAVEDGDERLTLIAETAGVTIEEFRTEWEADRSAAFARFADALAAAEDSGRVRDDLFIDELAELPVHPRGVLLGSGRLDRADGSQGFFLVYDVAEATVAVEETMSRLLDESPWQIMAGQSSEESAILLFQSTVNADVGGVLWVQSLPEGTVGTVRAGSTGDEEAAEETPRPETAVLYLIEASPAIRADASPFALPPGRPLPDGFPGEFLVGPEMTVTEVLWNTMPDGVVYRLTILTRESAFDVVDAYRASLATRGWDLTGDQAVGFETFLSFASTDGAVQGTIEVDAFADDEDYTEVVLQLQALSGGGDN